MTAKAGHKWAPLCGVTGCTRCPWVCPGCPPIDYVRASHIVAANHSQEGGDRA